MRTLAGLLLFVIFASTDARAADIQVPGDAPTIPAAIALAQTGDRIIVGPGTWVGGVDYANKALTVVASGGAAVTTINGGSGSLAVHIDGAPGTSVLDGFTVIGGNDARVWISDGTGDVAVRRCRILGLDGPGTGVVSQAAFQDRVIEDCLIEGNRVHGLSGGSMVVRHCLIRDNGSPTSSAGGGVAGAGLFTVVEDCLIVGNTAAAGGGGNKLGSVKGSVFLGNHAASTGGAYYELTINFFEPFQLEGAAFLGNDAPHTGGVHVARGGFAGVTSHTLTDCIFAGNTDEVGNLAVWSEADTGLGNGFTNLLGCTVIGNGVHALRTLTVTDAIVRGGTGLLTAGQAILVDHSNVEGGWPGDGNIDSDPRFVDAAHDVYALLPGSPCVDAGAPGSPRDPDGSTADMGALALAPFCTAGSPTFGQLGLPGLSGAGTLVGGSPLTLTLVRARPGAQAFVVLGLPGVFAPFKGGELVPAPQLVLGGFPVNSHGQLALGGLVPMGLPPGLLAWAQGWVADPAAATGFAASNGLGLVAP
jgi:hypothetical protein